VLVSATSRLARGFVAGVGMPSDADAGIVGEHAGQSFAHLGRPVSDDDLPRMQRVADTNTSAMVKAHPRGTSDRIEHCV